MDILGARAGDEVEEGVVRGVTFCLVADDVAEVWLPEELAEAHEDIVRAERLGFDVANELSVQRDRSYNQRLGAARYIIGFAKYVGYGGVSRVSNV